MQSESFLTFILKNLMLELKNYEENQKAARMERPSGLGELDQQQMGIIPVSVHNSLVASCKKLLPCFNAHKTIAC